MLIRCSFLSPQIDTLQMDLQSVNTQLLCMGPLPAAADIGREMQRLTSYLARISSRMQKIQKPSAEENPNECVVCRDGNANASMKCCPQSGRICSGCYELLHPCICPYCRKSAPGITIDAEAQL